MRRRSRKPWQIDMGVFQRGIHSIVLTPGAMLSTVRSTWGELKEASQRIIRTHLQLADGSISSFVIFCMVGHGAGSDGNEALRQATGGAVSDEVKRVPRPKVLKRCVVHPSLHNTSGALKTRASTMAQTLPWFVASGIEILQPRE